jgi:transcriptional regulator with XRE-family HTH domain
MDPTLGLGATLAAARRRRGWTLREAARRTGVHNAHLSQIEKGVILRPSPSVLFQIGEVYGVRFDDLLKLAGYVGGDSSPAVAVAFRALIGLKPELQEEAATYLVQLKGASTPEEAFNNPVDHRPPAR